MLSTKIRRAQRALDKQLRTRGGASPARGWLRAIREAIGMSGQQFADRLGVAWQSMDDLEKSEAAGSITLNSLHKAAAALNCRVEYVLVPNAGSFEELVRQRARQVALAQMAPVDHTMLLENQQTPTSEQERRLDEFIEDHIRDSDLWA